MKFQNDFQLNKKDKDKGLKLPKEMSHELAEIVGIHFGDGNMQNKYNHTYRLHYTCNIKEKQYAKYIKTLFYKVFNISLNINIHQNKSCINLYFYSKSLCNFFNKNLQVPFSPKKELTIPITIKSNNDYLKYFLRGIFDTDGCVTFQKQGKYKYSLIKITMKNYSFAKSLSSALYSFDISSFISTKSNAKYRGYDLVMRNKQAEKFFKLIGSNNLKNKEKWGRRDLNFRV